MEGVGLLTVGTIHLSGLGEAHTEGCSSVANAGTMSCAPTVPQICSGHREDQDKVLKLHKGDGTAWGPVTAGKDRQPLRPSPDLSAVTCLGRLQKWYHCHHLAFGDERTEAEEGDVSRAAGV